MSLADVPTEDLLSELEKRIQPVEDLDPSAYNRLGDRITEIGIDDSWGPSEAALLAVRACFEALESA